MARSCLAGAVNDSKNTPLDQQISKSSNAPVELQKAGLTSSLVLPLKGK